MPWVKLSDDTPEHPAVAAVSIAAFGYFVVALCYCNRQLTDGFLPARVAERLAPKAARLIDELGCVKLLTTAERDGIEGYQLAQRYVGDQPTRDEVLSVRRHRAEAGRVGGQRSGEARRQHAASNAEATTKQHASRLVEANGKQNRTPDPDPVPVPDDLEIPTSGKGDRGKPKPRSGARAFGAARPNLAPPALVEDDDEKTQERALRERHSPERIATNA